MQGRFIRAGETMADRSNPYTSLPSSAFWRTAVAEVDTFGLSGMWTSRWELPSDCRFATYGSCFAQHISRALKERKIGWIDAEPAPARTPEVLAKAYNYGVFSARTANIYTAAQLLLLTRLALGETEADVPELWEDKKRFYDSLRPAIEPDGFETKDEAILSRKAMLRAFRRSFAEADVFVFTLGLTEGWEHATTGQPYAMCPGTHAGRFDPEEHVFRNYRHAEIRDALVAAFALMRSVNPGLRFLLTVSPVPLTATASGKHVLVATTYSKSVLRAVAGELVETDDRIDYFPSYEIVTGGRSRAEFFEENMRSVRPEGVAHVMTHFFAGLRMAGRKAHAGAVDAAQVARRRRLAQEMREEQLACEEAALESFNRG